MKVKKTGCFDVKITIYFLIPKVTYGAKNMLNGKSKKGNRNIRKFWYNRRATGLF